MLIHPDAVCGRHSPALESDSTGLVIDALAGDGVLSALLYTTGGQSHMRSTMTLHGIPLPSSEVAVLRGPLCMSWRWNILYTLPQVAS